MSRDLGLNAEQLALDFLLKQGLGLIQTNFYSRFGEIDLIMLDEDAHVFIEVRKRHQGLAIAGESISLNKQAKLIKTAQYYLTTRGYEINCRFDAILVDSNHNIKWLKNIITLF
jgi:putative endonuclease